MQTKPAPTASLPFELGEARSFQGLTVVPLVVVAPYNAHVRRLREQITDPRIRIGTVDKFQGQQAAVVFYSMASSSGDDDPRGLEFLLSRNRLNVAISRAQ
jgi:superfamily I DNA and/or RNA helicase